MKVDSGVELVDACKEACNYNTELLKLKSQFDEFSEQSDALHSENTLKRN